MFGMDGRGQRPQAVDEGGRWSIQEFVPDTVNAIFFCSAHRRPAAFAEEFVERNPIAGSAPRGDHYIRVFRQNGLSRCLFPRSAYELSSGRFH